MNEEQILYYCLKSIHKGSKGSKESKKTMSGFIIDLCMCPFPGYYNYMNDPEVPYKKIFQKCCSVQDSIIQNKWITITFEEVFHRVLHKINEHADRSRLLRILKYEIEDNRDPLYCLKNVFETSRTKGLSTEPSGPSAIPVRWETSTGPLVPEEPQALEVSGTEGPKVPEECIICYDEQNLICCNTCTCKLCPSCNDNVTTCPMCRGSFKNSKIVAWPVCMACLL